MKKLKKTKSKKRVNQPTYAHVVAPLKPHFGPEG